MTERVVVLKPLRAHALDLMRARPRTEVVVIEHPTPDAVAAALPGAHALCIRNTPLPEALLAAARDLRVVSKHGVGLDNLPMDALRARRIPVATVGGANAAAVAEHATMLMLALARRLPHYQARARAGGYVIDPAWPIVELRGRRLVLIGLGRIGAGVARLAQAFGMVVAAYDPAAADVDGVAREDDLTAALGRADIVSVHVPLTDATAHLVDAGFLAAMRDGAMLVNTARGELVDEGALLDALRGGRLAGAALDVLEREPPEPANPLLSDPRVIVTPHVAALTEETADAMARLTAQNAVDGLDGRLDRTLVANPEVLE